MPDENTSEPGRGFELEAAEGGASKVSGSLARQLADVADDELLAAVVEVSEPGYVPNAAEQRAKITDTLFTANLRRAQLSELERDSRVVSVELNRRLERLD